MYVCVCICHVESFDPIENVMLCLIKLLGGHEPSRIVDILNLRLNQFQIPNLLPAINCPE